MRAGRAAGTAALRVGGTSRRLKLETEIRTLPAQMLLSPYSIGVGDRFAHQAEAQLRACIRLAQDGIVVAPVWNKSNREHTFIGSEPSSVLIAARSAVSALAWPHPWHVDADHIRLETVERFLPHSDFFTIDVADSIGKSVPDAEVRAFVDAHPELIGDLAIEGVQGRIVTTRADVEACAAKYLLAVREAGRIHRHIASQKGADAFIAEVSMDETDEPQTPQVLLVILAALADERVPLQTIAPKFTGRFNKGVDYVGDLAQFEREFNDDLAVVRHAVQRYGLPSNLKLSIHSGSDKFSLYPIVRRALARTGAGIHLKTAGTTWLEEMIGLAEAGADGLAFAREIYFDALDHVDELCAPYASVIDIDRQRLPSRAEVEGWDGARFAAALRHEPSDPRFHAGFRQLIHVAFKLAAKRGTRYLDLLKAHREIVGRNVTDNLYRRHLAPLFLK